ncbi:hypothetical protein TNCT_677251 [Trichonephila clavata]|uniref:Uncharacterized protein n=1 Tax=Trichonephila clavata TaxID=2740835 RepID=A0A8X6FXL8_TRICU|nr:hypothetical protein TNCT_677251 [Trichonephila clavata]
MGQLGPDHCPSPRPNNPRIYIEYERAIEDAQLEVSFGRYSFYEEFRVISGPFRDQSSENRMTNAARRVLSEVFFRASNFVSLGVGGPDLLRAPFGTRTEIIFPCFALRYLSGKSIAHVDDCAIS